jgi:hypothetical protein
MKRYLAMALALALGGCGNEEAFTIEIAGSPGSNAVSLAAVDFSDATDGLTGFKVNTDVGDGVVTYSMPVVDRPGHKAGEAIIELRFEPVPGKSATLVNARLDVPATRVLMGKANQVVSQQKVALQLQKALAAADRSNAVGALLTSVAIASNVDLQAQVNGALAAGTSAYTPSELLEGDAGPVESSDWGGGPDTEANDTEARDPASRDEAFEETIAADEV